MDLSSRRRVALSLAAVIAGGGYAAGACSATASHPGFTAGTGADTTTGTGNSTGTNPSGTSNGGSTGTLMIGAGGNMGAGGGMLIGDPTTCAEAAANKTYIGCDFWPTVTGNNVWSIFDFTAVVANAGTAPAMVTVTGPNNTNQTVMVAPNALEKIYLPWVPSLKGPDADNCGTLVSLFSSVAAQASAYHLVSSVPVTVYQFSALEYQGMGGPPGKNWGSCPGDQICDQSGQANGCFSFTNDASLLLPSTAMTGNYRITSQADWSAIPAPQGPEGAFFTITGTQANTMVTVYVASTGHIVAGNGLADTPGGGTLTFPMGAGDVVQLVGNGLGDLAGTLVKATAPVQVISGMPCAYQPFDTADPACDHLEQSVFPAETLGKHYFVSQPTSPHNTLAGHIVRIVGNADGTTLSYPAGKAPPGAPLTLHAGEVVDMGVVHTDFEVSGDHEFAVATFMLGASQTDPNDQPPNQLGDPSQSNAVGVEQYRLKYVFLAPTDYTESYVDITMPMSATVNLDGTNITTAPTAISSGYGIARILLGPGNNGAHVLTATAGVGIQVIGYGQYTSYQYPGGLNLNAIAPPPPPPK